MPNDTTQLPARFWAKVNKDGPEGIHSQTGASLGPCLVWTGGVVKTGYGSWGGSTNGRHWGGSTHRAAFKDRFGELPAKPLELDHLCRNPACCNPEHLEPVSHSENVRRGASPGNTSHRFAQRSHCAKGHAYDPENTYVYHSPTGLVWRQCRRCANETRNARRRRTGKR